MKIDSNLVHRVIHAMARLDVFDSSEIQKVIRKLESCDSCCSGSVTNNTYNITINGGATSIGDGWND